MKFFLTARENRWIIIPVIQVIYMIQDCRIEDIRLVRMDLPGDTWDIVIMETNTGLRGWGDVSSSMDIQGVAACLSDALSLMKGRSPMSREKLIMDFASWSYPNPNNLRDFRTALSGIDQCLWDLQAKVLEIPLNRLYGAEGVESVPLYANLNKALRSNRDPQVMGEHARLAVEEGFAFVKATPFDEVHPADCVLQLDRAFEKLDAITEHVSIDRVALDCHQRFTRYSLCSMIDRVEERYGIPFWVEDTVAIDDYEAQRFAVSRHPEIRYAAGEDAINLTRLTEIIDSNLYDVIMPDLKYVGGPTIAMTAIRLLNGIAKNVSLHNPNGLIATAHSAHLSTIDSKSMPMELPFMAVPGREKLASPTENIQKGHYVFNDEPGIGVELLEDSLEEYGKQFCAGSWVAYRRNR